MAACMHASRCKWGHVHERCMVQDMNSSMQGDLETFGRSTSRTISDGWENIDGASLVGFTLSVVVAAAVTMACDLVPRVTWIILAYMSRMHVQAFLIWMACQPCVTIAFGAIYPP
eukprot:352020-Chlamydomonas_euryale.AAC.7